MCALVNKMLAIGLFVIEVWCDTIIKGVKPYGAWWCVAGERGFLLQVFVWQIEYHMM